MKKKYGISIIIALCGYIFSNGADQKHIIFDCNGVLFKENKVAFARKLGVGAIAKYTFSHLKNPIDACLETIEQSCTLAGQKPHTSFTFMNKKMPECIVLWQQGRKSFEIMNKELKVCFSKLAQNNFFKSSQEQEIVLKVLELALHPENLNVITKPDKNMFRLIDDLKKQGHKIYMLTNMAPESLTTMKKHFPVEFGYFDDICISGTCGILVPEKKIFTHFTTHHNIPPQQCVFIDDEPQHVAAAQECGMHGIVASNIRTIRNNLKRLGLH